ncbi:MAG: PQQ-binding-like beta-propeller repeat protein [bacterium]|nr:c-type cytochrome [Gammaproteobacteria bacterium]HIL99323.1 c-type cytochrome [Pseudomonadales bacterium]
MTVIRRAGFYLFVFLFMQWATLSLAETTRELVGFTKNQANKGNQAYQQYCAACHGETLEGVGIAPPLKGARFDYSWRGKSAGVLSFHLRRMPPGSDAESQTLSDETHANILAYILNLNKLQPGDVELPVNPVALENLTIPRLNAEAYDPVVPVVRSAAQTALLGNLPQVTDEMLRNPSPDDWLHWGRTYSGQSYSPLRDINRKNVSNLKPAWRTPLLFGSSMPMPLVNGGVMFLHTFPDTIIAMDATNGAVLWRYAREGLSHSNKKMGLALHNDRIYASTSDLHVIALNAKTGKLIWDHEIDMQVPVSFQDRTFTRSAPLIAGKMVIQGTMGFRTPGGAFIVAVDRESGEEAWRFNTVAWPDKPGGNTWNDLPVKERNGGSVWHQGTYDPKSNLVYYGIAPTYDTAPLLVPTDKEGHTNEAMYTNSTVALNPDTGELVWYFQHTQNDQWDMDWVFERIIAELPSPEGGTVKAVLNVGKNVMLDALDAVTGQFLFSVDSGVQNVITAVDTETGRKTIDPTKMPSPDTSSTICPVPFGARSWPQTSYSPDTHYVYIPITESCFQMSETGKGGWLLTTGVDFGAAPHPDLADGMMGRLQAIDVASGKLAWNKDQVTPPSTGILSTGGGLIFSGDIDPSLKAFNDATGELLWEVLLDDTPSSSLITYKVDTTQYVAVVVGMTNNHIRDITRHYRQWSSTEGIPGDSGGASIWVFALP